MHNNCTHFPLFPCPLIGLPADPRDAVLCEESVLAAARVGEAIDKGGCQIRASRVNGGGVGGASAVAVGRDLVDGLGSLWLDYTHISGCRGEDLCKRHVADDFVEGNLSPL